jgi:hypothetical protein
MVRPGLVVAGAVLMAVVCIVVIPMQQAAPDFRGRQFSPVASAPVPATGTEFRETRWFELAPEGWDPYQQLRQARQGLTGLSDADPRAVDLLKRMREIWNNAPINAKLDGAAVRIPGYVVPLDEARRGLTEFLLVPYFGACIHTPPPPSNQIIHVRLQAPVRGVRAMDPVWVSGSLHAQRSDSSMGMSSYAMSGVAVERYEPPSR